MPKIIYPNFPKGDSCPVCGRRLNIIKDESNYKEAICNTMEGHCGWWGFWEKGAHRESS